MKDTLNAGLPRRSTKHSAGYDFYLPHDLDVVAGEQVIVDTGICLEDGDLEYDEVMLLFPRSSLGMKYGFRFLNSVGVIDSDYRDTIKAGITVSMNMHLNKGDRFMQGIVFSFCRIPNEIEPQQERTGGLGSTGH